MSYYSLISMMPSLDPDAQAFFAASAITGATQQAAINNLIKGLKTDGLWSKMKAVYPFVTDNRNLASYTEDFSNAYWQKVGAVVTANDTIAPDGTMTADKVVFSGINKELFTSVGGAGTYTISVYIKGTAGETISFGDGAGVASLVFTLTGNWQRINVTTTASNFQFDLNTYTGTARTIWLWGAQAELGSTATTYQPIATTQQAYIASQFKYNLKDPRDLDAAFRLVFNGGWTHSSTGATPNGTNGYADTKLNQSGNLTPSNNHISFYSRTDVATNQIDCGITNNVSYSFNQLAIPLFSTFKFENGSQAISTTTSGTLGLFLGASTSSTSSKLYKNGTSIGSSTTLQARTMFNNNIFLGSTNLSSANIPIGAYWSTKQYGFSTIGDGLTDTEAANLYTRVQAFQTALSRQV